VAAEIIRNGKGFFILTLRSFFHYSKQAQLSTMSSTAVNGLAQTLLKVKEEGNALYSARDLQAAVAKFGEAAALLSSAPQSSAEAKRVAAICLSNRAQVYLDLGQHQDAADSARAAIELDKTFIKSFLRLGKALTALQQYEPALDAYVNAQDLTGADAVLLQEAAARARDLASKTALGAKLLFLQVPADSLRTDGWHHMMWMPRDVVDALIPHAAQSKANWDAEKQVLRQHAARAAASIVRVRPASDVSLRPFLAIVQRFGEAAPDLLCTGAVRDALLGVCSMQLAYPRTRQMSPWDLTSDVFFGWCRIVNALADDSSGASLQVLRTQAMRDNFVSMSRLLNTPTSVQYWCSAVTKLSTGNSMRPSATDGDALFGSDAVANALTSLRDYAASEAAYNAYAEAAMKIMPQTILLAGLQRMQMRLSGAF
jgi:tetratricopeptide (TPR) repeat protein